MEPSLPLSLRRLRHVEYLAFISKGDFAGNPKLNSSSTSPSSTHLNAQSASQQWGVLRTSVALAGALKNPSSLNNNNNKNKNSNLTAPMNRIEVDKTQQAKEKEEEQETNSSSMKNISYRYFFPHERSCCRMEILKCDDDDQEEREEGGGEGEGEGGEEKSTSNTNKRNKSKKKGGEKEEEEEKILYRSEPIAPTRHPRFAPLSADVRHIGASTNKVKVRVFAESLTAEDQQVDSIGLASHKHQQQKRKQEQEEQNEDGNADEDEEEEEEEEEEEDEMTNNNTSFTSLTGGLRNDSLAAASAASAASSSLLTTPPRGATGTTKKNKAQIKFSAVPSSNSLKEKKKSSGGDEKRSMMMQPIAFRAALDYNSASAGGAGVGGEEDPSSTSFAGTSSSSSGLLINQHHLIGDEEGAGGNNNNNNNVKLMTEIDIDFSKLEYIAEHLSDATEAIRDRQNHNRSNTSSSSSGVANNKKTPQQQHQNHSNDNNNNIHSNDNDNHGMECLVIFHDGVFCVPASAITNKNNKNNAEKQQQGEGDSEKTSSSSSSIALLKRLGSEKKNNNKKKNTNQGGGGEEEDEWDVVASTLEPDRISADTLKSEVTSTLTLHFAQMILNRRAFLEKQRLVDNMEGQLCPASSTSSASTSSAATTSATAAAASSSSSNDNNNNQLHPNNNNQPKSSISIKRELTKSYRRVELDDLRRQLEISRSHLTQQEAVAEMLQEQLRGRNLMLDNRSKDVASRMEQVGEKRETASADREQALELEKQLKLCRNKILAGMSKIFPITVVAPHTICGFKIPTQEPQNEIHACALGAIVHAVSTFCSIHGHVPLHPLFSQTSRSSVAEYVGAPASKVYPLYQSTAAEKETSLRAVALLRRVIAHAAFAIHNQRQASDLPFAIALQKLLFNR